MQNVPLISIIVPLYCVESYLSRCIESILEQTYENFELILVDDGSTDGSPVLCDQYAASDNRIHVIHQENKGVSGARNTGLDAAHGEYIAFVDADDWVDPEYISYLLEIMTRFQVRISACNHFVYANGLDHVKFSVDESIISLTLRQSMDNILYHQPPDVSPWGKLYQRSLFENLRYPEGKVFEDTFEIADLLVAADGIAFGNAPKYHYRFHTQTLSKSAFQQKNWDYLEAVDHLSQVVLQHYPDLVNGCTRRRVHAALSIRRLLVSATAISTEDFSRCELIIRSGANSVLFNKRAPLRDKVGILLALLSRRAFDFAWEIYQKKRSDY